MPPEDFLLESLRPLCYNKGKILCKARQIMTKKVILDVDTGSDDAVAIMTALLAPEIDLLGVTVTHGNQPLPVTLENTLRVMSYMRGNVPVFKGSRDPLVKWLTPGRELPGGQVGKSTVVVDGKTYVLHEENMGLPPATVREEPIPAAMWIVDTIKNSPEKITVIPVGPCSNIAVALRIDPSIVENIEEIIIMGGADNMGNRTGAGEFNFFADPEAAKIVVNCGAKVTIIPLNATHSAKFDYDDAARFEALGTRAGSFTGRLIRHRCDFESVQGQSKGETAVHDALTVCALIDPSIVIESQEQIVDIDIGGSIADGMMYCDTRPVSEGLPKNAVVAYRIDKEKVLTLMLDIMSRDL